MTINSIELFTGAGGLAMGMQLAGCHHRALIEWDKDSCDTLRGNISSGYPPAHDWHVIQSDVRKINYSSLDFSVQLISGGPPCQPFLWEENIKHTMIIETCFQRPYEL